MAGTQRSAPVTVVQLADYGGPFAGSFISTLRAVGAQVRALGWGFECGFTPEARGRPWIDELAGDGIPVSFAPGRTREQLGSLIETRLGELEGTVILHTHFTAFELAAAGAADRDRGVAVVWHVHSFLPRSPLLLARSIAKYGWVGRRVARIVCASAPTAAAVRRRGAPGRRLAVVPNGIDTDHYRPIPPSERPGAKRALDLPESDPVLLHFAWNWRAKGGPLFCETLARLRQLGVPARGLSVGGGDEAREAAERLGIADALSITEPAADARRLYAAADAFVATSHGEGGRPPYAVLEALSCGVPVVATDIPGHRLAGGPSALRVGPASPEPLAEAIRRALALDPSQRESEASAARDWVVANRGQEGAAKAVVEIYRAVVGEL